MEARHIVSMEDAWTRGARSRAYSQNTFLSVSYKTHLYLVFGRVLLSFGPCYDDGHRSRRAIKAETCNEYRLHRLVRSAYALRALTGR